MQKPVRRKNANRFKLDCIHRGGAVEKPKCGCTGSAVFTCAVYGECVTTVQAYQRLEAKRAETTLLAGRPMPATCETCPDYVSKNAPPPDPRATDPELLATSILAAESLPADWVKWGAAPAANRLILERSIASAPAYPADKYNGRGIVIAAGGSLYFACAWVVYSILRKCGCKLPVQFWHLGRHEFDDRMRQLAESVGIEVIDASTFPRPRILNGWELKSFAVQHSRFEEVLFLDADNIPRRDPAYLFDNPQYKQHGAIFWPDLPPADGRKEWIPAYVKQSAGIDPLCNDKALESGQFVINKRECWQALHATRTINDHSDFWYHVVYGDKDTFWLGWHKVGKKYASPRIAADWRHPAILQSGFEGELLFEHVCQGKEMLARGELIQGLTLRRECAEAGQQLRQQWPGVIWQHEPSIRNLRLAGRWWYDRKELGARPLALHVDGSIGEGSERCEKRWATTDDGRTLVIVGEGHKGSEIGMMFLSEGVDGIWRGNWTAHERGPVELIRL